MVMTNEIKDITELEELLDVKKIFQNLSENALKNGDILYHYTSISGLEGILSNQEFWVSHCQFLNDSTEIVYTYKLFKDMLYEKISEQRKSEVEREFIYDMMSRDIDRTFTHGDYNDLLYVLSMTTNSDSNLLWANYSNNDGYNIGFKYPEILRDLDSLHEEGLVFGLPVIYDLNLQREYISPLVDAFIYLFFPDKHDQELYVKYLKSLTTCLILYSTIFKDSAFSQEEEFRFVCFMSADSKTNFRVSNGTFIPYVKKPFDLSNVVGLTIGPKNKMDIAHIGVKKFLEAHKYSHIKSNSIKNSKIPYRY
jgi:hypothetical protein